MVRLRSDSYVDLDWNYSVIKILLHKEMQNQVLQTSLQKAKSYFKKIQLDDKPECDCINKMILSTIRRPYWAEIMEAVVTILSNRLEQYLSICPDPKQLEEQKSENESLKKQLEEQKNENESLKKQLEEQENESLKKQLEEQKKENESLKKQLEEQKKENESLKKQLEEQKKENESLKKQL